MLLIALALSALAAPIDVETDRISLDDGYLSLEIKKNKLSMYVSDGEGGGFWCSEWGLKKRWESYESFFRKLDGEAASHLNADLGSALGGMQGFSGSQATGYCNASARTRDGFLFVTFTHNRACFGSAGCNSDRATFSLDAGEATEVADLLATSLQRLK